MYSRLFLKERNAERVVYRYGVDKLNAPSDGEVEFDIKTSESKVLKPATYDNDGEHAKRWVLSHLGEIVFNEDCPEKRVLAFG